MAAASGNQLVGKENMHLSVFVSTATMFLEFWKRKQATIQYDWDVAGYEMEERMRPEYEAKVKNRRKNPITQVRQPRSLSVCVCVCICACLSSCSRASVFNKRKMY